MLSLRDRNCIRQGSVGKANQSVLKLSDLATDWTNRVSFPNELATTIVEGRIGTTQLTCLWYNRKEN